MRRRRLNTDDLLKKIDESAGWTARRAANQLFVLSRQIDVELVPRHNSISVRFPPLDLLQEEKWLTLFVVTAGGTFYCNWLSEWRKAGAPPRIARRYEKKLESTLGPVVFHPGHFQGAIPLAKISDKWPSVRIAIKRAVIEL